MKLEVEDEPRYADPDHTTVQMNLRVPHFYRRQLIKEAHDRNLSINRLLINALVRAYPPEQ